MKLRSIAICVSLGLSLTCAAEAPKYVFLFIGDGMGMGHVAATQAYLREVKGEPDGLLMLNFPVAGICSTYSANSRVTDSAAAGSAIATGVKTNNSMVGMNADTIPTYSFAKTLKEQGYGIGVVSTCAPDDATPAAFYAHVPKRHQFYDIGKDMAVSDFDFFAGADLRGKTVDGKPTDLLDRLAANGYDVVRGEDAARKSASRKIVMLNTDTRHDNNIGYAIDSIPGVLTLPQITSTTLDHLMKYTPESFFMMVENGNVDHSAHSNDGGGVIKDLINLDQSIAIAYEFYKAHPDETLIVVTADHDTGGMANGDLGTFSRTNLGYIDYQKMHKDTFADWCSANKGNNISWDEMKSFLSDKLGFWTNVPISEKEEKKLRETFDKVFVEGSDESLKTWYHDFNVFAEEVYQTLNRHTGLYWTSHTHTGNYVPVFAVGVGAEKFSTMNDNTEISKKIMTAKD